MDRWVALLRGVNVGGVKITNADLAEIFAGLGCGAVKPVQAAGNVAFDAQAPGAAQLRGRIEEALAQRYGRPVPALVYRREQIAEVVDGYPFVRADETTHPYVMLIEPISALAAYLDAAVQAGCGGDVAAAGVGLYWRCPRGQTLTNPLSVALDKVRGADVVTNRNLRTLEKLAVS